MNVFVSYAAADRPWAEKLKNALREHGISVWGDTAELNPGESWTDRIEQAIRNAEAIVVLAESQSAPDEKQRRTWQSALEAVWADSSKRLIPFLLGEVEVPRFVRASVSSSASLPVIRVREPEQDWEPAIQNLVAVLRRDADWSQIEQVPSRTEQDFLEHQRSRAQIGAYVEKLKASLNLP